jgi:hypothetical protein
MRSSRGGKTVMRDDNYDSDGNKNLSQNFKNGHSFQVWWRGVVEVA